MLSLLGRNSLPVIERYTPSRVVNCDFSTSVSLRQAVELEGLIPTKDSPEAVVSVDEQ